LPGRFCVKTKRTCFKLRANTLASIGRLFTTARSRIAEACCVKGCERGIRRSSALGRIHTSTSGIPRRTTDPVSMRWGPPRDEGMENRPALGEAQIVLRNVICAVIARGTMWERKLVAAGVERGPETFARVFHCSGCPFQQSIAALWTKCRNPESGWCRLNGTSRGIPRKS